MSTKTNTEETTVDATPVATKNPAGEVDFVAEGHDSQATSDLVAGLLARARRLIDRARSRG